MTEGSEVSVVFDDSEDPYEIDDVRVSRGQVEKVSEDHKDPFAAPATEIRALSGISKAQKRRITRQITKSHTGRGDAHSTKLESETVTGYQAFEVIEPIYNLDYLAMLYELCVPHFASVNAKSSNIVGLGYKFIESPKTKEKLDSITSEREVKDFRRKLETARNKLDEKLDRMNTDDTFGETLDKVWIDYEATGNGYIEIGRTVRGDVGYIGHIPSTSMRVRRARDGFVQIIADQAVFFRNFGDKETPDPIGRQERPNEVIHIKKYSPRTTYYGLSDIIPAKSAVAGNEFSARYNLDFFENKAIPRHVIILKGATLSSSAERAVMDFFETGLKGKNHRTLYVPLPADSPTRGKVEFRIEAVAANIQDSSFVNYRKENRNEILMAHRVPVTKIGVADSVSLAVARDADKTFKEQVCQPEQRKLEKKLNKIFGEMTNIFLLKLNELTLTDADTQSKIDERLVKIKALLPNEVRADRGMTGIKGGDQPLDLSPQQSADARARGNRERDSQRSAAATDSAGEGRNPKGEGRTE